QPKNRIAMLRAAQISHDQMILARNNSRYEEALELAHRSAGWLHQLKAGPADKPDSAAILVTYLNVADQHMLGREFDESLRLCQEAADLARSYDSPLYVGTFHWVSGEVYRRQGDLDQGLKETSKSVDALQASFDKNDQGAIMNYILALTYRARILGEADSISMGRSEEAVADLERAFNIADGYVHRDPNDQSARGRVAMAGTTMAAILNQSNPRRALEIYDHVLEHAREIKENSSFRRFEVTALAGSSYALRKMGRSGEAHERLEGAMERLQQINAYPAEKIKPGSEADMALRALADFQAGTGNYSDALATTTKLREAVLAWKPSPDTNLVEAVELSCIDELLANIQKKSGQRELADETAARRLALWRHWDEKMPGNPFVRHELESAQRR